MEKNEILSGSNEIVNKMSVKQRNMILRQVTNILEHQAPLDEYLTAMTIALFEDTGHTKGCEKYREEALNAMSASNNEPMNNLAANFQKLQQIGAC